MEPFITFYGYEPGTGRYIGPVPGYLDPLESHDAPVYVRPACAVEAAPAGELPPHHVFQIEDAGTWRIVPDYRTQPVFDTRSGQPLASPRLGEPLPDSATLQPPPAAEPGCVVRWQAGSWAQCIDYSRETVRRCADGVVVAVAPGAPLPDGCTVQPYPAMAPGEVARWDEGGHCWCIEPAVAEPVAPLSAEARLQQQLAAAYAVRRPLEDAAELGIASDAERQALGAWKRYCVDLSRLPQLPTWPELVADDWPPLPA